jgi:tetratricopeptide (TPR) repeat protein
MRGAMLGAACLGGAPLFVAMLGCAAALKEARPLTAIAAGTPAAVDAGTLPIDTAAIDDLVARAGRLYQSRGLDEEGRASVREAADLALRAAAADPTRTDAIILSVRARIWLADHEAAPADRESAATAAVEIAQSCGRAGVQRSPDGAAPQPTADGAAPPPACAFWLGAALGVQARERPSTGLSALPMIEAAFKDAAAREPLLDDGGPDRALALLYLRAPGWPTGPGDPDLGLEHARRAIALKPDYPPNVLALAEALAATGDSSGSREQYARALELARAAGAGGEPDAAEWILEAERALAGQIRR